MLEAGEVEPDERIRRRELVDDEDRSAGARDARELGDQQLRPRRVVQRPERACEVERRPFERQMLAVGDEHLDVRRRVRARPSGERLVELDGDHLAHPRGDREGERACTRADVERSIVAAELKQPSSRSLSAAARSRCSAARRSAFPLMSR